MKQTPTTEPNLQLNLACQAGFCHVLEMGIVMDLVRLALVLVEPSDWNGRTTAWNEKEQASKRQEVLPYCYSTAVCCCIFFFWTFSLSGCCCCEEWSQVKDFVQPTMFSLVLLSIPATSWESLNVCHDATPEESITAIKSYSQQTRQRQNPCTSSQTPWELAFLFRLKFRWSNCYGSAIFLLSNLGIGITTYLM